MTDFNGMIDGYRRFHESGWQGQRTRWKELTEGQSPRVMVIACSDSRVDPAIIFDSDPGEMFVVRNVAALVPPYETTKGLHGVSAALEYAVQFLEIPEILVMGHGRCGGCDAALSASLADAPHGKGRFVADWIGLLDEAREKVISSHGTEGREAAKAMELEAVKVSLSNLMTFPYVAEKVEAGKLSLHGAYFAIKDGELHVLDQDRGAFETVR